MKLLVSIAAGVFALGLTAGAQDTKVKSRTKFDADEGHVVSMTGCIRRDALTGRYSLHGTVAAAGDEVKTRSRVETDVDRNGTKTKSTTRSEADGAVATSGALAEFPIVGGDKINLGANMGRYVQLSAVMVDPNHKDADVKVENRTTVDPDDARDTTTRSKTRVEVDRAGQYTVVSVTPLAGACPVL